MSDALVFEDTEDVPAGRKARVVSAQVWQALEDSAKRGVAKTITADSGTIDELRKDLASAAVRAKFDVVTATAATEGGGMKLRFSATAKPGKAAAAPVPGPVVAAAKGAKAEAPK